MSSVQMLSVGARSDDKDGLFPITLLQLIGSSCEPLYSHAGTNVYATAKVLSHIRDHFRLGNIVNLALCIPPSLISQIFRKLWHCKNNCVG